MSGALPVVLVKGEDPVLLGDAVRDAVDEALAGEDRSLATEELGGDELTVGAVIDAATTPPFLTGRRVIVVRDIGRWGSDALEPLIDYLADPLPSTSLVLVAGGGQTSTRLLNAIKKVGRVIDAAAPRAGKARTTWVTNRLKAAPVRFDAAAGARLVDHLGEDLGRLSSIIEMLVSAFGEGARIGVNELEPFLGSAGGIAPWDLTDAIDRGDTAASLNALARLLNGGERHPLVVLSSLHRHFAAMLRLDGSGIRREEDAAAVLGMAPFPARKVLTQAGRLGSAGIARAIDLIAGADLDLRGLKEWPDELVLEVLVARLSRLGSTAGRTPTATGRSGTATSRR
jgi:DNA polymerase-3 subunit delta